MRGLEGFMEVKMAPGRRQNGPGRRQDVPQMGQDDSKTVLEASWRRVLEVWRLSWSSWRRFCKLSTPWNAQDGSKMFRRCFQDAPRRLILETLRWASAASERAQRAKRAERSGLIRVGCVGKVVQKMLLRFAKVYQEMLFKTCTHDDSLSTRFPFLC